VIMVLVQSPNADLFLRAPHLAIDITVFPAGASLEAQSAVAHSCRLLRKRSGVWISASVYTMIFA
jgi:hypothetical protein